MADTRLKAYADLLATRCLQVRPGQQIVIEAPPLAMPLVEELTWVISRMGGYVIPYIVSSAMTRAVITGLPEEQLAAVPPIYEHMQMTSDAQLFIQAPENTRALTGLDPGRVAARVRSRQQISLRRSRMEVRWTVCNYPTHALAQDAEMSLAEYEDFLYSACLVDWEQATELMNRVCARFDAGAEVRIIGPGTDLRLSLKGRTGVVDDGVTNMPGGEVFYPPVEEATEGYITYDFPAIYQGREVDGIRLEFCGGRVVDATAQKGEDLLIQILDTDPGARILGEFGIGCNYGIQRFTRDILFDEKIGGTVHLAVGRAFSMGGGRNQSAIHWDMIKDLRQGGQIWLDGQLVQENGRFVNL